MGSVPVLLFFISLLVFPNASFAQVLLSDELPVELKAGRITYSEKEDVYVAEGEAVAVQGGVKVEADRMLLNRKSNTVAATGNVVLTDEAGDIAEGKSLEMDIVKGTGVINKGKLFYKAKNFHITGERITKVEKDTYRVERGRFTTCDCSPPAWGFSGSDLRVTGGEYLSARHTFFYIKEIPLLYSPYVALPIKKERQTGFLFPGLGFSDLKGVEINNSFFWAMAKNRDATFYFDYLSKRGEGKGIEYRYIRKRDNRGELFFYHFKEKDIDRLREFRNLQDNLGHPEDADNNRWFFRFDHSETLPYGIILKVDIDEVSDDEYFLDFGKDQKERALKKLESNMSISKRWRKFNLVTQFSFFDNLLIEDDKDTLQRLPEVTFTGSSRRIQGTPVYLSLKSSYNNFYRKEGIKGHRIDLHPEFSLPLKPGGAFEFTPRVGLRETLYHTNEEDKSQKRDIYDLSLEIKTTFIRIFDIGSDRLQKMRHSIRPSIKYSYIPNKDQTSLPSFDGKDRIARKNMIDYSLTSFLTGKLLNGYRDYLSFKLSQGFDINEARWNLTSPGDKKMPLSDLKAELILTPVKEVSFKGKGDYNVYDNRFSNYNLALALKDRRGDRLDVSYIYKRGTTEYLDMGIDIRLNDNLDIFHKSRFSYLGDDSATLETVYGINYKAQCWGIKISRIERPDDTIFLATVNLLGLGDVVKVSGSEDF